MRPSLFDIFAGKLLVTRRPPKRGVYHKIPGVNLVRKLKYCNRLLPFSLRFSSP